MDVENSSADRTKKMNVERVVLVLGVSKMEERLGFCGDMDEEERK